MVLYHQLQIKVVKIEMGKVLHEFVVVFVNHFHSVRKIMVDSWLWRYL